MIDTIICIGNGQEEASHQSSLIALENKLVWCGVLDFNTELTTGCYHTSIYDIKLPMLLDKINGRKFTKVIVLDQDQSYYKDKLEFFKTIDLGQSLVDKVVVEFLNSDFSNPIKQELIKNKSFCIMPFISLCTDGDDISSCCTMKTPITDIGKFKDFKLDSDINHLRTDMLANVRSTKHCNECYKDEDAGMISSRQTLTQEWAYKLNLKSIEDIHNNTNLISYDISVGNKCNAMCRSCVPDLSNLISKEYIKIGLDHVPVNKKSNFDLIDISNVKRVYINGGEPTISQDFFNFLQKCIDLNKLDVEIIINTNAFKLSEKFLDIIKNFSNLKFEISIDGYQDLQYYIRHPIAWDQFKDNVDTLYQTVGGRKISFNTVVSIYNISSLYNIINFLESNYPETTKHLRILSYKEFLVYTNFPDKHVAVSDLEKIKSLDYYKKDETLCSQIDGLIAGMSSAPINTESLKHFFKFNDLLDKSRNISLKDYIPQLDYARDIL